MSWCNGAASVVCPSVNICANRFFSQTNGRIATKLAQDGLQVSVHPGCAQGQGQGQRSRDMRTFLDSWNELLRHWRSGSHIYFGQKMSCPLKLTELLRLWALYRWIINISVDNTHESIILGSWNDTIAIWMFVINIYYCRRHIFKQTKTTQTYTRRRFSSLFIQFFNHIIVITFRFRCLIVTL